MQTPSRGKTGFWHRHGLGIAACFFLLLWFVLYTRSSPNTHWGSFFGNAIADWSGVVVTVYATKYLFEIGSSESKRPRAWFAKPVVLWLYDHSLTVFLLVTGIGWVVLFSRSDPQGKWGQVVGNIVSEWTAGPGAGFAYQAVDGEGIQGIAIPGWLENRRAAGRCYTALRESESAPPLFQRS